MCPLADTLPSLVHSARVVIAECAACAFRHMSISGVLFLSEQKLDEQCDADTGYIAWRSSAAGKRAVASDVEEWQRLLVRRGVQSLTD